MEGNHLPKRSSKLDHFLRKNLPATESGSIRYYEKCVAEAKGALLLRHIILTDESLYVTQNPPKSWTHSISLSKIHGINLVPDRQPLLSGGPVNNAFISQHIQIKYASGIMPNKAKKQVFHIQNDKSTLHWVNSNLMPEENEICLTIPTMLQMAYQSYSSSGVGSESPMTNDRLSTMSDMEESVISKSSELQGRSLIRESSQTSSEDSLETLPETSPHRSSSVLEQNLSSWRSGLQMTGADKRRPSSVDISKLPSVRRSLLSKYFKKKVQKPDRGGVVIQEQPDLDVQPEFEEINLYIYEPDSTLLNELFLYWSRQLLKSTLQMGSTLEEAKENPSYGLRVAGKIFLDESKRLELLCNSKSLLFLELFPILCNFHKGILRYHHLKRLCLNSQTLVTTLLGIMKSSSWNYPDPNPDIRNRNEAMNLHIITTENVSTRQSFQEQLSTNLILFDIFRILIEDRSGALFMQTSGKSNNKNSDLSFNWNWVLKSLLEAIFTYPVFPNHLPLADRIRLQRICSDPQTFATLEWTNGPDAQIIHTFSMGHNTAVALLHEILSVVHYSRGDRERTAFMGLLKLYPMDTYLRQSVTQVINLLWSTRPEMTASQCVLFHRHVSVLMTLVKNLAFPKKFLRQNFAEEFQYFVHEKSASMKIPDRYPIKPKLVNAFTELRNKIIRPSK